MSDISGVLVPDQQHTPEFKLQVALEYLRNPRRKKRILKEKGITEEQFGLWHRDFLDRATQIFGEPLKGHVWEPLTRTYAIVDQTAQP